MVFASNVFRENKSLWNKLFFEHIKNFYITAQRISL